MSYLTLERVLELVQLENSRYSIYEELIEKEEVICQKAWYFGQQWLQAVQDFDILGSEGLFFFCTLLKILRQGVNNSIYFALIIIDLEVV